MHGKAYRIASSALWCLPLANTCEKHLLTDHLSALQPHPIANIGELSVVTIIDSGRTTSFA